MKNPLSKKKGRGKKKVVKIKSAVELVDASNGGGDENAPQESFTRKNRRAGATDSSDEPFFQRKFRRWCKETGNEDPIFLLLFYVLFIVVVFAFGLVQKQPTPDTYYLTNSIVDVIIEEEFPGINVRKSFRQIGEEEEMWEFLEGPFSYLFQNCTDEKDIRCHAKAHKNIYIMDKVILTQVRVKGTPINDEGGCVIPALVGASLSGALDKCYYAFDTELTDTDLTFNKSLVPESVAECFTLYPKPLENTFGGFHTLNYGKRGYACLGETVGDSFTEKIKTLHRNGYVDEGTRAVYLDFTAFSPGLGLFLYMQVGFEFLAAGSLFPYYSTNVFQAEQSNRGDQTGRTVAFVFLYLFVSIYCTKLCCNFYHHTNRKKYCTVGKMFDAMNYALLFAVGMLSIDKASKEALASSGKIDAFAKRDVLQYISSVDDYIDWILSVCIIFTVVNVFEYVQISKKLSVVVRTLIRARIELFYSLITISIVIFGYSIAFHVAFGSKLAAFRSVHISFLTCISTMFVDVELREDLWYINRVLGPLLLLTYMLFVTFIVMSLCLAIIETAFHQVTEEMKKEGSENDPLAMALKKQLQKIRNTQMKIRQGRGSTYMGDGATNSTRNLFGKLSWKKTAKLAAAKKDATKEDATSEKVAADGNAMQSPKPTRWTMHETDDGTPYYYDNDSGITQWENPMYAEPVTFQEAATSRTSGVQSFV